MMAGWYSVLIATLGVWFFLLPPTFSFTLSEPAQAYALAGFFLLAVADVGMVGLLRLALSRVRTLNDALSVSNQTLTTVFEANPDAILLTNRAGRITTVNRRTTEVFRIDRATLLGAPLTMLIPKRFHARHEAHHAGYAANPLPRGMGIGLELFGLRPDGSEFPVDIQIGPITGQDDSVAIATVRDLTEQKALADALARAELLRAEERERLAEDMRVWLDAFSGASIGMVITDAHAGTVRYANPAFAAMRGQTVAQVVGVLVLDMYAAEDRPTMLLYRDQADRTGHVRWQTRLLRAEGEMVPVELDTVSRRDETGTVRYRVTSVRDISEERQTESALREKSILLNEIHHRVKNNLQVISSLLYLQGSRISDPAAAGMLRDCQNRVVSMATIHQMLYQSGDFSHVPLRAFLEAMIPVLLAAFAMDTGRVTVAIPPGDIPLPIKTAIPCGLIVNELITNTLKHAFPGGRRGTITVGLEHAGDGSAMLSLADDGVGIPDHVDLEKTGTLGLELVYLLTAQIGGEMDVRRSGPTRFALRFPLESAGGF